MNEVDATTSKESELLEKCREVALKCGKNNLYGTIGWVSELSLENLNICYSADWGGRQYITIKDGAKRILLIASNNQESDHPFLSQIIISKDDRFQIHSYEPSEWEQRIDDIYSAITLKAKEQAH